jgi:hypothetical protein
VKHAQLDGELLLLEELVRDQFLYATVTTNTLLMDIHACHVKQVIIKTEITTSNVFHKPVEETISLEMLVREIHKVVHMHAQVAKLVQLDGAQIMLEDNV